MEPIESSETSAYINTLTPGTFPKEKKLQYQPSLLSDSYPKLGLLNKSQSNYS